MSEVLGKIGKFELLQKLGSGHIGDDYMARDPDMQRQVVIKIIHQKLTRYPEFVDLLFKQLKGAAKLQHKNIETIYDFGKINKIHYCVREYVQGESLDHLIKSGHKWSLGEKIEIALQTIDGLSYAHKQDINHGELKPSNFIVSPQGIVRIANFGLSFPPFARDTQSSQIVAAPAYMSPEQARGAHLDSRSDIFSLGVVLYELLTFQRPFVGKTIQEVIAHVLNKNPIPPSRIAPAIPQDLEDLVMRCLDKDPDQRYQTAESMGQKMRMISYQLTAQEKAATVDAPPPRPPAAAGKKTSLTGANQNKVLYIAAAAVVVIVVAAFGYWKFGGSEESPPAVAQQTITLSLDPEAQTEPADPNAADTDPQAGDPGAGAIEDGGELAATDAAANNAGVQKPATTPLAGGAQQTPAPLKKAQVTDAAKSPQQKVDTQAQRPIQQPPAQTQRDRGAEQIEEVKPIVQRPKSNPAKKEQAPQTNRGELATNQKTAADTPTTPKKTTATQKPPVKKVQQAAQQPKTTPENISQSAKQPPPPPVQPAVVVQPAVLTRVEPKFPPQARRLKKSGVVILKVLVGTDGTVAETQMVRSSGFSPFDKSATTAVLKWQFAPGTEDGKPTAMYKIIRVDFGGSK